MTHVVSSWGRLARIPHQWAPLADRVQAPIVIGRTQGAGLAFGNGRSYGDVALNAGGTLWATRGLDRFISFDADHGILECEAGTLLKDVIDVALPRGWFLPVVPGTRFVTVGGAIANDVHGKGHHRTGSFGDHVEQLVLLRTDGTRLECGPLQQADWFAATVGGLGLTGVIESARLRLRRVSGPWLDTQTLSFDSLDGFFELSGSSAHEWEYTVAWIDCARNRDGATRGIFFRGNHAAIDERAAVRRPRTFPFTPPISLVNRLSVRLFNQLYFHAHRRRRAYARQHYLPFFFPLDNLLEWNRIYGPRGFYQYQCVVPAATQRDAVRELLRCISASRSGSFLAVLKMFGDRTAPGLLSFPMPGTTLALDFPNEGERTLKLFDELNAVVLEVGGRLYPAKDACMPRQMFERGYPRLAEFLAYRDPGIASDMSRRLLAA